MRIKDAQGRTGTHHLTYELPLPDGRVLRTRISHPPDRTDYGKRLWSHILKDQLDVIEAEFWACVHDGATPDRGSPVKTEESVPAQLVHILLNDIRLPEAEVAKMSKQDAIDRVNLYWTEGE
ncbi:hypothetical protein [Phytoactinopolyspora endophytica]|uniref:hypothetical protein n=1 Tax=Phytoactinopolyspora endophytica TaxID=1642495 RepID=UPI00197B625E|nr:hypothetical protein [Phytoactinopolyspora endophytica]